MARATVGEPRKANKRGAARLAAVQALYQMDLAGTGLNDILAEFESHWLGGEDEGAQYRPAEAAFFRDIVGGVVGGRKVLVPQIQVAGERGSSKPCSANWRGRHVPMNSSGRTVSAAQADLYPNASATRWRTAPRHFLK